MRHILAAVLAFGCSVSAEIAPRDCTPGTTGACVCPGGVVGVQVCDEGGAVGACSCPAEAPSVPAGASDAATPVLPTDAPATATGDAVTAPGDAVTADAAVPADVALPPDVVAPPPQPSRDVVACEPRNLCGTVCVTDYSTDPMNCGGCFVRCHARADGGVPACSQGVCVHRCAPGLVACGPTLCVDPSGPRYNCAECGNVCAAGFVCSPRTSRCERG